MKLDSNMEVKPKFNLIDEPWIKVTDTDYLDKTVSLSELFRNSSSYLMLNGETKAQDLAVLRLLLAILHTVFSRKDVSGNDALILCEDDAIDRWEELWRAKELPFDVIKEYFDEWRDRFYLFHPERPFFQVPISVIGQIGITKEGKNKDEYKSISVRKLNAEFSESDNKIRLFSHKEEVLAYDEAARWLIYTHSFDDASLKKPSPKVGWLGNKGIISAYGSNLFETLILNMVMLQDGNKMWGEEKPTWEAPLSIETDVEKATVPFPNNLSELYTLQMRRIILVDNVKEGNVSEFFMKNGCRFSEDAEFYGEQMGLWGPKPKKETDVIKIKNFNFSKQAWRQFPLFETEYQGRKTGLLEWLKTIEDCNCIDSNKMMIGFNLDDITYASMNSSIDRVYGDSVLFPAVLIKDKENRFLTASMVESMIKVVEKVGYYFDIMIREILSAAGYNSSKDEGFKIHSETEVEKYYLNADTLFRKWLMELYGVEDSAEAVSLAIKGLKEDLYSMSAFLAENAVTNSNINAIIGRGSNENKRYYSAAQALNIFYSKIYNLLRKEND